MAYKNEYYDDAIANPDKYTWGIWDASKPLSPDNWQPKPRKAGDARDPNSKDYQKPFSVSDGFNYGTSQSNTLESLANQFYKTIADDNFASTLPKFDYSPGQGAKDQANYNQDAYNLQKRSLQENQDLVNQDAWQKLGLANTTSWFKQGQDQQAANSKASMTQFEKTNPNGRTISYSSILDPSSAEGQKYQSYQVQDSNNKSYAQNRLNDAEVSKQSQLLPLQTQATIQTQAPQFASQQKVADIQAEAQKAVAEANARAMMYGANLNAMSSMFGSQMGAVGSMFGGMNTGGNARYW